MAGKIQLAAKVLLGTTLLTSGAGGVYYATANGWSLAGRQGESAENSRPEIDAVASAWTESAAKSKTDAAKSSTVARSATDNAKKSDAAQKKVVAKPKPDDRYAVVEKSPTPAEVTKNDDAKVAQTKKPTESQSTKKDDSSKVKLAAQTEAKAKDIERAPAPAKSTPEPDVARGQEPKDDLPEPAPVKIAAIDNGGAVDNVVKSGGATPANPKVVAATDQPSNIANTAERAKQAFGASPLPPNDRYGDPPPPQSVRGAAPQTNDVNPFGPAPISPPPANSKNDRIQPLATGSNDAGTSLRQLQPTGDTMRQLNPSNSARSANRGLNPQNNNPSALSGTNSPANGFNSLPSSPPAPLGAPGNASAQPIGGEGIGKPGEKALEGPQQPTLVIQKFAPGEIQVGKPAKFVLQVRNAGGQAADSVTIQDEIPQGTQLISTTPNATNDNGRLVWQLGKLSPGEDRTVEMQVMPKAEGELGSVATVTYSAQASVKARCTMPQLAIRMTAPSEVMVGKQQHVKIELRNPGSGDATGVMLFENVPANVKHVAGPTLEFEIGTLRAGETRELDLVLMAEKPGKVVNTLTARAQGNLQVQQQVEFDVIAPALTVAVQGPERRYLERPATYEVSVENPGTAAAHDVQIVTKLPKGLRFVKANNMGEYDATSHAVYWSLAELPKGERGTVELVAMPVETGPQTLQVESRAQQGLADKAQREVLVEGLAAIKFEVRALQDPVEVGGETGYEIRVLNQGTKAAANVQVSAELAPGLKILSAESETQHRTEQGRIIFEPIGQLAPKADTVFRIRAQGVQAGDQRIVVEVKTDDLEHPIRREESTRVFGDE
jgi:uncharacterized repeat protein (TIGR01451 family)